MKNRMVPAAMVSWGIHSGVASLAVEMSLNSQESWASFTLNQAKAAARIAPTQSAKMSSRRWPGAEAR